MSVDVMEFDIGKWMETEYELLDTIGQYGIGPDFWAEHILPLSFIHRPEDGVFTIKEQIHAVILQLSERDRVAAGDLEQSPLTDYLTQLVDRLTEFRNASSVKCPRHFIRGEFMEPTTLLIKFKLEVPENDISQSGTTRPDVDDSAS